MKKVPNPLEYIIEHRPDLKILGKFSGWHSSIEVECIKCGRIWFPTYAHIYGGNGCSVCSKRYSPTKEEFREKVLISNPHLELLEEYKGNNKTKVKCRCNICGYTWDAKPEYLVKNHKGCPACVSYCIVDGINSFIDKQPDLAKMLKNIEDAKGVGEHCNTKLVFICPNCGNEVISTPQIVVSNGLSCKRCGDGISYPNKFVYSVLSQMKLDFVTEIVFDWSEKRRYDFYIPSTNTIIEVHGIQHYEKSCNAKARSLIDEIENDIFKYNLAISNYIHNYIVIDARYSRLDYITQSIVNSDLFSYKNFNCVDFSICEKDASSSLVVYCADLWNSGISRLDIENIVGLCKDTIGSYLRRADDAGLLSRPLNRKHKYCIEEPKVTQSRAVICINTGEVYPSIHEAGRVTGISVGNIGSCCQRKRGHAGKDPKTLEPLMWKYYNVEIT